MEFKFWMLIHGSIGLWIKHDTGNLVAAFLPLICWVLVAIYDELVKLNKGK